MGKLQRVSIPPWFDFASSRASMESSATWFQSHLGSILPGGGVNTQRADRLFQSHLGSILPCTSSRGENACVLFQSHLGSILPRQLIDSAGSSNSRFNPTLVRFCPRANASTRSSASVSIPPWFDFAHIGADVLDNITHVSIPPWFDFAPAAAMRSRQVGWFQSHLGSILPH